MGRHDWTPPQPNEGVEGYLFEHNAVRSSRQFLQANLEGGRSLPPLRVWSATAAHLYDYPGDMKLYQGAPAPKGKHAAD